MTGGRHRDEQPWRRQQPAVQSEGMKPRRGQGQGHPGGRKAPAGRRRGTSQQIRHRKRRRRPGRKRVLTGNDTRDPDPTLRPRSGSGPEEKLELVGRRTLEVLAASPTPAQQSLLAGILDLPAVRTTTPSPAQLDRVKTKDTPYQKQSSPSKPASRAKHHVRGRKRADRDNVTDDSRPLDPNWLQRLLTAAAVGSARASTQGQGAGAGTADKSPCERWLSCSAALRTAIQAQLTALPACPCTFPASVFYYNKIWDRMQGRYFRWRDASGGGERLDIYHPGASQCIRSLHTAAVGIVSAQHCCYDRQRRLLTRGSGAGTPALVSPDVSAALHDSLDVRPWRVCKGDFTRYNELRPPNNGNQCSANPDDEEYLRQTELSQSYR